VRQLIEGHLGPDCRQELQNEKNRYKNFILDPTSYWVGLVLDQEKKSELILITQNLLESIWEKRKKLKRNVEKPSTAEHRRKTGDIKMGPPKSPTKGNEDIRNFFENKNDSKKRKQIIYEIVR